MISALDRVHAGINRHRTFMLWRQSLWRWRGGWRKPAVAQDRADRHSLGRARSLCSSGGLSWQDGQTVCIRGVKGAKWSLRHKAKATGVGLTNTNKNNASQA